MSDTLERLKAADLPPVASVLRRMVLNADNGWMWPRELLAELDAALPSLLSRGGLGGEAVVSEVRRMVEDPEFSPSGEPVNARAAFCNGWRNACVTILNRWNGGV